MICAIDIYVYIYAVVPGKENSEIEPNSDHWSELVDSESYGWQELEIEDDIYPKDDNEINMGLSDHAINDININLDDDEFETVVSDQWFRVVGVDLFDDSIRLVKKNSVALRVIHMNSMCLRRTKSCAESNKVSAKENDVYYKSVS
jgi:hypothetical protein